MSDNRSSAAPGVAIDGAPAYYEHPRPEVAALVPATARVVIDVGCGAGALGRGLKAKRPELDVRGIEPVKAQAERARAVLNAVHCGTAEAGPPSDWPTCDCLIFADVLEHLLDPWSALRSWKDHLAPDGTLILSLPNVSHRGVLKGIWRGRWDYQDSGVLDRTHLRFFTRRTGLELVEAAGFSVASVRRILDMPWSGFGLPVRLVAEAHARWELRSQRALSPARFLADASTVQFLIVAKNRSE